MEKIIVITLYRRPEHTQTLFDRLARCHGINEYTLYISCDQDAYNFTKCQGAQLAAATFVNSRDADARFWIHDPPLGIDLNKVFALEKAFQETDFVILLEDDTPISEDALRYFEWGSSRFKDNKNITSISAYNRVRSGLSPEDLPPYACEVREGFCPWGFGIWRDRYEKYYGLDGAKYKEATGAEANGKFDHFLHNQESSLCVRPILARSQHAAYEDAVHTPSKEWWLDNEWNPVWAGALANPLKDSGAMTPFYLVDKAEAVHASNPGGSL